MSASTAKATRRDLKRALGDEGLKQVHALTALVSATLVPTLEQHTDALNQQNRELKGHDRQLADYHERLARLEAEAKNRAELTFWGRMSWALTGH